MGPRPRANTRSGVRARHRELEEYRDMAFNGRPPLTGASAASAPMARGAAPSVPAAPRTNGASAAPRTLGTNGFKRSSVGLAADEAARELERLKQLAVEREVRCATCDQPGQFMRYIGAYTYRAPLFTCKNEHVFYRNGRDAGALSLAGPPGSGPRVRSQLMPEGMEPLLDDEPDAAVAAAGMEHARR
jgi:hypothetical protein